jgi:oxaloacetate decarboxylase alpha subunit
VFTVRVKVGDQVTKGDTILVLEAMKMETDIRANGSGKVSEINVKDGDSVKVGDVLLSLG